MFDDIRGVRNIQAANTNERMPRKRCDLLQAIQTQLAFQIGFGRREKNWTDTEIIHVHVFCLSGVLNRLNGQADDFIRTKIVTRNLIRHIALTNVDTIRINCQRHIKTVDFIKRYVFPGSCIPSISAMCSAVSGSSDLRLVHLEDITPHYARTLRSWRHNVVDRVDEIRSLGYSDTFLRLWEFYLCYCEGSFAEGYNRDVQMVLIRPQSRLQPDPKPQELLPSGVGENREPAS